MMWTVAYGLLGIINFALAGWNVYLWTGGGEFAPVHLAFAVFCFGVGIFISARDQ